VKPLDSEGLTLNGGTLVAQNRDERRDRINRTAVLEIVKE
jgi:hypothetical protein